MRDFDDIILDLSDKWDTLSRNQQRYIATTAAGSRQQSRFIALLSNSERLHELIQIAEESAGRSQQQFDKYADTIEYKIKKIQNTWEKFRVKLLPEKVYKAALNYVNIFLERITNIKWVDIAALSATFLTAGKVAGQGLIKGLKDSSIGILNLFSNLGTSVSNLFSSIGAGLFGEIGPNKKLTLYERAIAAAKTGSLTTGYDAKRLGLDPSQQYGEEELIENRQRLIDRAKANGQVIGYTLASSIMGAISSYVVRNQPGKVFSDTLTTGLIVAIPQAVSRGFSVAEEAAKNGAGKISSAMSGVLTTVSMGIKGLAVSALIGAAAAGIKAVSNWMKEREERIKQTNDAYYRYSKQLEELTKKEEELNKAVSESQSAFNESKDSYDKLIKNGEKLKDLNKKLILTEEEKQESLEISNELAENFPELIKGYDNEGNAIINLTDAYEELVKIKKENYDIDKQQMDLDKLQIKANEYAEVLAQINQAEGLGEVLEKIKSQENVKVEPYGKGTNYTTTASKDYYALMQLLEEFDANTSSKIVKSALKQHGISSIEGEGEDFLDNLEKWLADNAEANLQLFWSAVKNYQLPSNNLGQKEILKGKELENYIETLITDNLISSGLEEKTKNKNAMKAVARRILSSKTDLSMAKLKKYYYNLADKKEFATDIGDKINSIDFATAVSSFSQSDIEAWDKITKLIDKDTTYRKQISIIGKYASSEDLKNWINENEEKLQEEYEYAKKVAQVTGSRLFGSEKENWFFGTGTLGDAYYNMGIQARDNFLEALTSTEEISPAFRMRFIDIMQQLLDKVGPDKFNEIIGKDWKEYDIFDRNELREQLGEGGEEFLKIIEDVFTKTEDIADNTLDKLEENFDTFLDKVQAVGKAAVAQVKNGYADASSLKALRKQKVPIDQLMNEDATLDIDKTKKYITEEYNKEIARTIDEAIKEDELKREGYKLSINELKAQKAITKEKYIQARVAANMSPEDASAEYDILIEKGDNIIAQLEEEARLFDETHNAEYYDRYRKGLKLAAEMSVLEIFNDIDEAAEDTAKKAEDNAEKLKKANKAVADAYDDILEKQKALLKAQERLEEVLYGSDFHKGALDNLYNYQKALEVLNDTIEQTKEDLENLKGQNPKELLDTLFAVTHSKNIYLAAQNERYNAATKETESMLNNELQSYLRSKGYNAQISDFYRYNSQLGYYEVDQAAIAAVRMNDNLKDFVANQIDTMNTYLKAIKDNNREQKKLQKEMEDYQKQTRDKYIEVQEEVVEKLKESYQKEIDDKKEMYDALTEADNKYLDALEDAINKQRKLRDKQDKWDELATKEKKLSLLQRDTSGAAAKETQKLQQDIQKDRQNLLDDTVDEVVDNLKELYETQQETREIEIEYQQSVLDNANLIKEANAIILSWKSMDEMAEWMYQHTADIDEKSDEMVAKLIDDWHTMYDNIQVYNQMTAADLKGMFNITAKEVNNVITNTSDTLVNEAKRALEEIKKSVDDSITDAQDSVKNAMNALTDAQEKYNEALGEQSKLNKELAKELENQNKLRERLAELEAENGEKEEWNYDYRAYQMAKSYMSTTNGNAQNEISKEAERLGLNPMFQYYINHWSEILQEDDFIGPRNITGAKPEYYLTLQDFEKKYRDDYKEAFSWLKDAQERGMSYPQYIMFYENLKEYILKNVLDGKKIWNTYSSQLPAYANGGLVDYTGLAMVHGSKDKPESFLSAEDTIRLGEAANVLRDLVLSNHSYSASTLTPSIRDSNVEIHIHVDSIATEEQVDYLIDRMKEEIVDAANPIGSSVIVH